MIEVLERLRRLEHRTGVPHRDGFRQMSDAAARLHESILGEEEESEEGWGPNEYLRQKAMRDREASLESMAQSGKLLTARELAEMRGVKETAISEAYRVGRIFRIRLGKRFLYPRFFAEHPADRKSIEKVCQELGSLPGSAKLRFFVTPKSSLGGQTPLEALEKADGLTRVLKTARGELDK